MILARIWNYLCGYVIIEVSGRHCEKFLNICVRHRIYIFNIFRNKDRNLLVYTGIKSFRNMRHAAFIARVKIRILRKCGLPFVISRYKRRKFFIAGAILFLFLLIFMTSFVWEIELDGVDTIDEAALKTALYSSGIKPGVWKYTIDTDKILSGLIYGYDEIAWARVRVAGTKLFISIAERKMPPELVDESEPCDLVAVEGGVIELVNAIEGVSVVNKGMTVKKGDILVKGEIPVSGTENETRLVHSKGNVFAKVWYYGSSKVLYAKNIEKLTGRRVDVYSAELFGFNIKLPFVKNNFKFYKRQEKLQKLAIGKEIVFPLALKQETYIEKTREIKMLSPQQAVDEAYKKARKAALKKAGLEETDIKGKQDGKEGSIKVNREYKKLSQDLDGNYTATYILECIKNIAKESPIQR